jgi:hypothetical protein
MNWLSITPSDLEESKVAALVNALRTAALGAEQEDPVPGLIQGVVDRIRAEVAACDRNRVDADLTTIPKGLRLLAHRMILASAKNRLEIPLTQDERTQARSDERYLERISRCELPVETPDSPLNPDIEQAAPLKIISSRPPLSRTRLKGL